MAKKSKHDMTYHSGVDISTLYNWRKYKPNLYRIVMLGFKFDELTETHGKNYEELLTLEQNIEEGLKKSIDPSS